MNAAKECTADCINCAKNTVSYKKHPYWKKCRIDTDMRYFNAAKKRLKGM